MRSNLIIPNDVRDLINLLVEKRTQLKLSQYKLSKKVDVAHTSIARIENGEMNPSLRLYISIANELGYDLILQEIKLNSSELQDVSKNINTSFLR